MKTEPSKPQGRFISVILLIGIILGAIYISPNFKNNILAGASAGFLLAAGLCYLIFPGLLKSPQVKRQMSVYWLGQRRYFTHPTMLPTTLGMLWFLLCVVAMMLFPGTRMTRDEAKTSLAILWFLDPSLFLVGLSGFLMILRKDGIDKFGRVYHGFPVYFNGILALLMGWGGGVLLTLSVIFHW
jgi:hypothetical protein